ncbi:hypothetical protein [Crocosphaera sp. XPORK-15E]|uniref:hypothetical protein n=1 Tax=Crocosphaera sp. XPORK-15E TaxID=3110247 RepID=UPI002B1F969C|nr:hypothetical protein [Crocosphaera sp. XPORK-15E]MEA5536057.1 hypothetical protein [Crocosphaera sp. XPORK-15E]
MMQPQEINTVAFGYFSLIADILLYVSDLYSLSNLHSLSFSVIFVGARHQKIFSPHKKHSYFRLAHSEKIELKSYYSAERISFIEVKKMTKNL